MLHFGEGRIHFGLLLGDEGKTGINNDMVFSLGLAFALSLGQSIPFETGLTVGPFSSGGRTPCPTDPIAYKINNGTWREPKVGDVDQLGGTKRTWAEVKTDKDGWFSNDSLRGGYVYVRYDSDINRTATLDASGHSMVYVNGVPRGGDPYGFGYVQLPIQLKKGLNEFLFSVGRGRLRAALKPCDPKVSISNLDPTLPDIIVGEDRTTWGAVLISNATNSEHLGRIRAKIGEKTGDWIPFRISPMTVKKVPVPLPVVLATSEAKYKAEFELDGDSDSKINLDIESKLPTHLHRRTFRSRIDGSVQYYAVLPASNPEAKSLVLSLHGASVEAISQAASYGQKAWCTIVSPTNGRPYGWDWEDWGRINAMETLEDAKSQFKPDRDKIYLTGHSMGGHGTWSIGFNHSDQFAAIAPCAGWISFWSYGGAADWKDPDPIETLLRRAANSSDTLKLIDNAKNVGIYIQHGDADDNVPVEQAREMRKQLAPFHRDFDWHEEPGQSHWFDTDPEAGANVQDTPFLFDFLAKHRIPNDAERRVMSLTVTNPDGSSQVGNVKILVQSKSMVPSKIKVRTYADASFQEITTENVEVLQIMPLLGKQTFTCKIDGTELTIDLTRDSSLFLSKVDNVWRTTQRQMSWKLLEQEGGVKTCFDNSVTAVYGTKGSKNEKDWAYNKARFDAETWWYRGNGSVNLMSDQDAQKQSKSLKNIVYYGNPETNESLKLAQNSGSLLSSSPFSKSDSHLELQNHKFGNDCGILWGGIDRKGNRIGIIGGTSLVGMRAVERVPIFLSGVHFPDFYAIDNSMYLNASKGVVGAGFYGPNWEVRPDQFSFRN